MRETDGCGEAAYGAGGGASIAVKQGLVRGASIGGLEFVRPASEFV